MSLLFKTVEKERVNFAISGIAMFGEVLPKEEGRKFYFKPRSVSIAKECSLRRQMHTIAIWLDRRVTKSFEEIKEAVDGEKRQ